MHLAFFKKLWTHFASLFRKVWTRLTLQNISFLYKLPFFTKVLSTCPICGNAAKLEAKNIYTELDRCQVCGHVYARKQPKKRILSLLYSKFQYWIQERNHQGIQEMKQGPQWQQYLESRFAILHRSGILSDNGQKCIFEIGCSEGMLLKALMEQGHDASGCEMNRAIAEQGIQQLQVNILPYMFEKLELAPNKFDAVISFHTLEHLALLTDVLQKIVFILKPHGILLVEVPSGKEEYSNLDHLHFFCAQSLTTLLNQYFQKAELIENSYKTAQGILVSSLYGIGKLPRK